MNILPKLIAQHNLVEGDKVVCVSHKHGRFTEGAEYTLIRVGSNLRIKSLGDTWTGDSAKFELVKPAISYPNPPHKHAELIKAWADGADIEIYITVTGAWQASPSPSWVKSHTYRIKPTKSAKDVKLEKLEANMRKLADEIKELRNE